MDRLVDAGLDIVVRELAFELPPVLVVLVTANWSLRLAALVTNIVSAPLLDFGREEPSFLVHRGWVDALGLVVDEFLIVFLFDDDEVAGAVTFLHL